MTTLIFDEKALKSQLDGCSPTSRLAFAILCCERMLPNYEAFSDEESFGNPAQLRLTLDMFWKEIEFDSGEVPSNGKTKCQELAPDADDYQSLLTSPALNAAVAISLLFDQVNSADSEHAVEVATLARDTVDMYVQEIEGIESSNPNLETRIASHPLMQDELNRQQDDLRILCGKWSVSELKSRPRVSNIGLS